jgi:hypothetical protein
MVNWSKIANDIITTEFPSFGVLSHLSMCTYLDKKLFKKKHKQISIAGLVSLKVLSQAWGIDFVPCSETS